MWLNDLADACRKSGLTVHELSGWKTRDHGQMGSVIGVICHHTGSSGSGAEGVVRNGRPGLAGPLAQLTLRRDGSVGVISHGEAWHAGTGSWPSIGRNVGNDRCLGIEAVYDGSDITAEQRRAYPRLVAALCKHYRIPVGNVIGHREWAPNRKIDPGKIDMPSFRREVQALVNGKNPAPTPAPQPSARPTLSKGMYDNNLVLAVQKFMNRVFRSYSQLAEDGDFGPATERVIKEFQNRVGLQADGVIGNNTWSKLVQYGFR
jgi:peptidoglycan hydrolase-like protein with peptidoglycan-binding domain